MLMMKCLCLALALLFLQGVAVAQEASEAKAHYQKATSHFAVGEFAQAGEEYQTAYKLKPDPALLFNAAQSYRLASNNEKALILYKNFLNLYPNSPNVDDVRTQIVKLDEAIKAAEKAKASQPAGVVEPAPVTPQPAPAVAQPDRPKPVYKKWWFWTALAGAVVVAGTVVTVAVVTTRPTPVWVDVKNMGPGALTIGGSF
jgi:tetratricopeptide (TPR) repeat protein